MIHLERTAVDRYVGALNFEVADASNLPEISEDEIRRGGFDGCVPVGRPRKRPIS